jgi:hypothetical protein
MTVTAATTRAVTRVCKLVCQIRRCVLGSVMMIRVCREN